MRQLYILDKFNDDMFTWDNEFLLIEMNRIFATAAFGATAAVGLYSLAAYTNISKASRNSISVYHDIPETFASSHTVRNLVNPNNHPLALDSRSITIRGSKFSQLPDEALLARFVKGFFGGWVFTPERYALKALNISTGPFPGEHHRDHSALNSRVNSIAGLNSTLSIWNLSELSDNTLPPISTSIFGAFQIADINLSNHTKKQPHESSIDIVFGSPSSTFAGSHRLSIHRDPAASDAVTLSLSCVAGNPTQNKPMKDGVLLTFHRAYAMMLFRDAVAAM